jgi:hypothetical protein
MGIKADGMGPPMASWPDVEAYTSAMGLDLEPWEKATLMGLSYRRAAIISEQTASEMKKKSAPK